MKKLSIFIAILVLFLSLSASQEYVFTTCGAEGETGPTQDQCDDFYNDDNEVEIVEGGIQEWEVPETGLYRIEVSGAQGGDARESFGGDGPTEGGEGARVSGYMDFDEGETLDMVVGHEGWRVNEEDTPIGGGWGGGGPANTGCGDTAGTGGGASDIRVGGTDLQDRIMVAGAGGGGAIEFGDGGAGGVEEGEDGHGSFDNDPGEGGTQNSGGDGGRSGESGSLGEGGEGEGSSCGGPGGGGGYYGGGGATHDGAGGGSSLTAGQEQENEDGVREGDGLITIEYQEQVNDPEIETPFNPDKSSASSTSDPASMNFDVDVDLDQTVDNSLESCSITAEGQDNGGEEHYEDSDPSGDSCEFTIDNNDNDNWGPGEEIEIEIEVEDSIGGEDTLSREKEFVNTAPEIVEIGVAESDIYEEGVWGGENGVTLDVSVVDYESASTNTDASYTLTSSVGIISSGSVSNGEDSFARNWERDSASDMNGFERGEQYTVDLEGEDSDTNIDDDSQTFDIIDEPEVSGPSPTDGDSAENLEISVDDTPAADIEGTGVEVEFWIDETGVDDYQHGDTQTVSAGETASVSIEDLDISEEEEWYMKISDENDYSKVDYSRGLYSDNTNPSAPYSFTAIEPPEIHMIDPDDAQEDVPTGTDLELEIFQEQDRDTQLQIIDNDQGASIYDETLTTGLDEGRIVTIDTGSSELANEFETEYNWYADLETQTNEVEYTEEESPEYSDSSNPWTFTTWDSPDEPSLVSPSPDGAENIEREPDLTVEVNQHDTADELEVDYYQDTGEQLLGSKIADVSDSDDQVTLTGDEYSDFAEDFNTEYSWYVEVTTPGGDDEEISSTWSFTTVDPGDLDQVNIVTGHNDNLAYDNETTDSGTQDFELQVFHEDDDQEMQLYFYNDDRDNFHTVTGYESGDTLQFNAVNKWNDAFTELNPDEEHDWILEVRHPVDGQIHEDAFTFTTHTIDVSWSPDSPDHDFFRVYHTAINDPEYPDDYSVAVEQTTDISVIDANINIENGENCYRVTALSLGGESEPAPANAEGGDECANVN